MFVADVLKNSVYILLSVFSASLVWNFTFKMKLILILVSLFCFENSIVSALRFDIRNPITVDHPDGVIEIGRPTKFTCAYMTSRSDSINAIRWYISYKNSNDNYGNVSITIGTPPRISEVSKKNLRAKLKLFLSYHSMSWFSSINGVSKNGFSFALQIFCLFLTI